MVVGYGLARIDQAKFMGHRVLLRIAVGLLLGGCWAADRSRAEDALTGPDLSAYREV